MVARLNQKKRINVSSKIELLIYWQGDVENPSRYFKHNVGYLLLDFIFYYS